MILWCAHVVDEAQGLCDIRQVIIIFIMQGTYCARQVLKLVEMGFDEASAAAALRDADGDENVALERLLGG